ncbi:MAG: 3-deoxy-8-phosphooctulonate synthase [Boseongicola sp. SB0675_bin_26]|nr:3-deoxy-8-phosphooctulonate synthase [Boseongicola sp. SB0675_bin_26]
MREVSAGNATFGHTRPLVLIAGPCQLESIEHSRMLAERLLGLCQDVGIDYVFKASYDKANRSGLKGRRGPGIDEGLSILSAIRDEFGCPALTDVHETAHCAPAAEAVDILQVPAFLCRQTDLLLAAGETGAAVNVKKGQFMAPWNVGNIVEKIESTGNERVILTERGASFGYNMLVSDMRSIPIMAETGCPVVFDATHSVQLPGARGDSSGGQAEFVEPLARAAVAVGVSAVFIETHEEPMRAPSDGPNMIPLEQMGGLLQKLIEIDRLVKGSATPP